MKRKIALFCITTLVLSMVGYGTYAYMTASKTTQNIITAGTVKIELSGESDGQNIESEGTHKSFEEIKVMPATVAYRDVTVKNTGANSCYVRVKLDMDIVPANEAKLSAEGKIAMLLDDINWMKEKGDNGYWRYSKKLEPGESTTNLLKEIQFDKSMGNEYQNATFNLIIIAQAVQAQNNSFDSDTGSILDVKGWPQSDG